MLSALRVVPEALLLCLRHKLLDAKSVDTSIIASRLHASVTLADT